MKKLIAIAVVLVASVAQANDYKTTKKQELPSKTKQVVEFKEHWTWNNKIKKWTNKDGRQRTSLQLLSQKEIKLVPVGSAKKTGPFVYVWDDKNKRIRIICTGFGVKYKGIK